MTKDQDTERDLREWLAGPLDQLPDRYLDAALDEIETTRQRRRRRLAFGPSNRLAPARYLLAAGAAVLVVGVGFAWLRPGGFGGNPPTPTGTATPAATPADRRVNASTFVVPFTITVPNSWLGEVGPTHRLDFYGGSSAIGFWGVSVYAGVRLYTDPCHPSAGFTTPGEYATPADLVAGLRTLPGLTVSNQAAYSSPGHAGVRVDFHYSGDTSNCELPNRGVLVNATNLTDHDLGINNGYQLRWFVTMVKARVIVIEAWSGGDPSLTTKMAEIQPVIDSITFD